MAKILLFGVAAGLLIAAMQWVEYRFLVVEHSVEIVISRALGQNHPNG